MDCVINQEYSIACLQEGDEVYVPFTFLHEYFEVYGSLSQVGKGPPRFDWAHSNAKVNYPKGTYDPRGIFMYFENYNVEVFGHGMPLMHQNENDSPEICCVAGTRPC